VGHLPSAAVAIAASSSGALLGLAFGEPHRIGASAFLAGCMAVIAIDDARRLRVPDSWNLAAALGGFVAAWLGAGPTLAESVTATGGAALQAGLCGGAFLLLREAYLRFRGTEGLGLGDVKLAATGGIWLGWQIFAVTVMLAAFVALVWVARQAAVSRAWRRDRKIPFGAFLAPAIWVCWYGAQFVPPG
jgi:leader peptidase (prepilin peptidase)/N-methyltransferase